VNNILKINYKRGREKFEVTRDNRGRKAGKNK